MATIPQSLKGKHLAPGYLYAAIIYTLMQSIHNGKVLGRACIKYSGFFTITYEHYFYWIGCCFDLLEQHFVFYSKRLWQLLRYYCWEIKRCSVNIYLLSILVCSYGCKSCVCQLTIDDMVITTVPVWWSSSWLLQSFHWFNLNERKQEKHEQYRRIESSGNRSCIVCVCVVYCVNSLSNRRVFDKTLNKTFIKISFV